MNKIFDVDEKTFTDAIQNHSEVRFDPNQGGVFYLIKKYQISNKEQLKLLILNHP
jgi:hypothetical protein